MTPKPAHENGASIQGALNRVGRRLNVHDVRALEELDTAFREWSANHGLVWFDNDLRLARAIAAVIHVELVEEDE